MEGALIRALRTAKRLSQATVARSIGANQPRLSLVERGHRKLTTRQSRELERLLALGEPSEDDSDPWFILVQHQEGRFEPLFDANDRLGIYRERGVAEIARQVLELAEIPADVAPAWLTYAATHAVRRLGKTATQDGVFVVGFEKSDRDTAAALVAHVGSIIEGESDGGEAAKRLAAALRHRGRPDEEGQEA